MRARRNEVNISLHGKARGGKDAVAAQSVIARKPRGFDQLQPLFDAAWLRARAVVVEDAFAPRQAERRVLAPRKNGCVLDRNAALVEIAVERPGLELAARELAFVHHQVKRMLVVIALFTNGVKAGDELGFGEQ